MSVVSRKDIATLWSGYGKVTRLTFADGSTLVKKQISPPSMQQSDRVDESHMRKMISYEAERYFYTQIAPMIENAYVATIHDSGDDFLLMEDLSVNFPAQDYGRTTLEEEKSVLEWLANFHASLWAPDFPTVPPPLEATTNEKGVWEEGSYWYLRTRKDEFESLRVNDQWRQIGTAVDAKIREIPSHFITLVHGDVKSANIVFTGSKSAGKIKTKTGNKSNDNAADDRPGCALYDFQYVGRSPGVRDVVYYLISSSNHVQTREMELLQHYHATLISALRQRDEREGGEISDDGHTKPPLDMKATANCSIGCGNSNNSSSATTDGMSFSQIADMYTFDVMVSHYELCMLDYFRFMKGWGMWGNSTFAQKRCEEVLKKIEL